MSQTTGSVVFFCFSLLITAVLSFSFGPAWLAVVLTALVMWLAFWLMGAYRFEISEAKALLFLLLLHIVTSYGLAFFGKTIVTGFAPDSNGFTHSAMTGVLLHEYSLAVFVYQSFLQWFAKASNSLLTLYITSLFPYVISCVVLREIMKQLELERFYIPVLFLFSIFPNDVIHSSIAMREPWQVMFIMFVMYFSLSNYFSRGLKVSNNILLLLSLAGLGVLHHGLLYVAVIWIPAFWFIQLMFRFMDRIDMFLKLLVAMILLSGFVLVLLSLSSRFSAFSETVVAYAGHVNDAGSSYPVFFEPGQSMLKNIVFLPVSLLYYWFYPFPWDISRVKDLYGMLLGLVRLILVYYSIYFILHTRDVRQRYLGGGVLVMCVLVSMVFAIGTSNYGTSMRHNMLTLWGFSILGVSGFYLARFRKQVGKV